MSEVQKAAELMRRVYAAIKVREPGNILSAHVDGVFDGDEVQEAQAICAKAYVNLLERLEKLPTYTVKELIDDRITIGGILRTVVKHSDLAATIKGEGG